ncbi:MAG: HEPN domain-containing protein [Anaerolineae bacterium]
MSEAANAFNRSIKDADELLARFDEENKSSSGYNAEALKRAGLVMAMAAWETYVKDRFNEEFTVWLRAVDGSQVGKFVRKRKDEDLKRFFNPNSEKTKRLFLDYFEVDITQGWKWDNYDVGDAKKALDSLVAKRGDAAHKANTIAKNNSDPHLVKREELEKAIRFLIGLVAATDKFKITK